MLKQLRHMDSNNVLIKICIDQMNISFLQKPVIVLQAHFAQFLDAGVTLMEGRQKRLLALPFVIRHQLELFTLAVRF